MLKQLRIKLFGKSKKELFKNMQFLCSEILDDLDDFLVDLEELHESVKESNRLILDIQKQCNEIIAVMEKDKDNEKDI